MDHVSDAVSVAGGGAADRVPEVLEERTCEVTDDQLNRLVELHVFGDDLTANTDERLAAALLPLRVTNHPHRWQESAEYRLRAWKERRDDKSIFPPDWRMIHKAERIVAGWRAEPRPFLSDWNATMLIPPEMRDNAVLFERYVNHFLWTTVRVKGDAWDILWQLDQRSIVLAALRAKGVEVE